MKWKIAVAISLLLFSSALGQQTANRLADTSIFLAVGATVPQGQFAIFNGGTATMQDPNGTQSQSWELAMTGTTPSTTTITIKACMRGGTCNQILSSGATSSVILSSTGIADNYQVAVAWTGGDTTTKITVNRTATVSRFPEGTSQFPGAPSGTCTPPQTAINQATSAFFWCQNGSWAPISAAAGAVAFSAITPGSNTGALQIGAGGSLTPTGGGNISANQVNGNALPASKTIVGTDIGGHIIDATGQTLTNNTSGNANTATTATTATGLASVTPCPANVAATGINNFGVSVGCFTPTASTVGFLGAPSPTPAAPWCVTGVSPNLNIANCNATLNSFGLTNSGEIYALVNEDLTLGGPFAPNSFGGIIFMNQAMNHTAGCGQSANGAGVWNCFTIEGIWEIPSRTQLRGTGSAGDSFMDQGSVITHGTNHPAPLGQPTFSVAPACSGVGAIRTPVFVQVEYLRNASGSASAPRTPLPGQASTEVQTATCAGTGQTITLTLNPIGPQALSSTGVTVIAPAITAISVTGGNTLNITVGTVAAAIPFIGGTSFTVNGTGTAADGLTFTVNSPPDGTTQFSAPFTHANFSAGAGGTVTDNTANLLTVTMASANACVHTTGTQAIFAGLTTETYLNGTQLPVIRPGCNGGTTFTAYTTHAAYGTTADTGTVGTSRCGTCTGGTGDTVWGTRAVAVFTSNYSGEEQQNVAAELTCPNGFATSAVDLNSCLLDSSGASGTIVINNVASPSNANFASLYGVTDLSNVTVALDRGAIGVNGFDMSLRDLSIDSSPNRINTGSAPDGNAPGCAMWNAIGEEQSGVNQFGLEGAPVTCGIYNTLGGASFVGINTGSGEGPDLGGSNVYSSVIWDSRNYRGGPRLVQDSTFASRNSQGGGTNTTEIIDSGWNIDNGCPAHIANHVETGGSNSDGVLVDHGACGLFIGLNGFGGNPGGGGSMIHRKVLPGSPQSVSGASVTSNVLTVTMSTVAACLFTDGQVIFLSGFAETFLNGLTVKVKNGGANCENNLTPFTTWTATFTHANFSNASEPATATARLASGPLIGLAVNYITNNSPTFRDDAANTLNVGPNYIDVLTLAAPNLTGGNNSRATSRLLQNASLTNVTLCDLSQLGCPKQGQYHIHGVLTQTGTCTTSTGSLSLSFSWTDTNGTAHVGVLPQMIAQTSATATAMANPLTLQTTGNANAGASVDYDVDSNGSAPIQFSTVLTACGGGTVTYGLNLAVVQLQ